MGQENRVVVLIDMDCFYCQVEEKLTPELKGKPIAVVQYNPWKGGGIIAVNYVARAKGVTRHMRGDEAKEKCPEIELPSVPCLRGKADISKYRDAGKEVARVLQKFTPLLERASIDEAYLDITAPVQDRLKSLNVNMVTTDLMPNTYALGYDSVEEFLADVHSCGFDNIDFDYEHAKRLLIGAVIVSEIRAAVYEDTGYRCSAGIAHNKILAKLVCGMNKPNKQTVLPKHSINLLYQTLPLKKVKHLGGKFGDNVCEVLKLSKMGELQRFSEKDLQTRFDEKNGTWLYNVARGIDLEPVQARFNPKSIGCCKQFRGKAALLDLDSLRRWLRDLADEVDDRLEKDALENNRTPKQMVVSFSTQMPDGKDSSSSRSYNFLADDELCGEMFADKALELLLESAEGVKVKDGETNRRLKAPIKFLGISVGKFEDHSEVKKVKKILDYFGAGSSKETQSDKAKVIKKKNTDDNVTDNKKNMKHGGKEYIMQKFFQVGPRSGASVKQEGPVSIDDGKKIKHDEIINNADDKPVIESTLDRQESFFAKMLNSAIPKHIDAEKHAIRPTTPVCDVVKCGEDSNDSEYSNSTINHEINKSIALFEEDPHDVSRVSSIRQLLHTSKIINDDDSDRTTMSETDIDNDNCNGNIINENSANKNVGTSDQVTYDKHIVGFHEGRPPDNNMDTFECPECNKTVPISKIEEHSDYHLALKLREADRQELRKEVQHKKEITSKQFDELKKKSATEECNIKNESVSSIASFLVKIDDNVPSKICSECGKKIALHKFSEHLDFHEAKKLSRELNKRAPIMNESTVKRKRKSTSPVKKTKMPCRPIDSFFR